MSHKKTYAFCSGVMLSMNNEAASTSFQIVEQIEVIKKVVSPAVSKLND